MNEEPLKLVCTGTPPGMVSLFEPCLEQAVTSLYLAVDFTKITLILDDLKDCDDPWLYFQAPSGTSSSSIQSYDLEVHMNSDLFIKSKGDDSSVFSRREIWESREAPRQAKNFEKGQFLTEFCEQYMHHHLLLARDIARRELIPGRIPSQSAEAFQACWAVTVDARLRNWNFPAFPLTERRRHFSRLFSQAGVLMPNHWSIFQALWEGGISGQRAVLEATGRLPSL
jgi:hypothetical protein